MSNYEKLFLFKEFFERKVAVFQRLFLNTHHFNMKVAE